MLGLIIRKIQKTWFLKIKKDIVGFAKKIGVNIGADCQILDDPERIFGSEPWLITVGNHCEITGGVRFFTHEGAIWVLREKKEGFNQCDYFHPTKVGNNVMFGVNSLIMCGVEIGDNVIIAAGSIVTKNVPSNSIVAGNPARIISSIDACEEKYKKKELFKTKAMSQKTKKYYLEQVHPEWFE